MQLQSNNVDPCVAAWLYDIRNMTEMECTSMLLAKSIARHCSEKTTPKKSGSERDMSGSSQTLSPRNFQNGFQTATSQAHSSTCMNSKSKPRTENRLYIQTNPAKDTLRSRTRQPTQHSPPMYSVQYDSASASFQSEMAPLSAKMTGTQSGPAPFGGSLRRIPTIGNPRCSHQVDGCQKQEMTPTPSKLPRPSTSSSRIEASSSNTPLSVSTVRNIQRKSNCGPEKSYSCPNCHKLGYRGTVTASLGRRSTFKDSFVLNDSGNGRVRDESPILSGSYSEYNSKPRSWRGGGDPDSSLDSACGSSPPYSSFTDSPVRASSPLAEHPTNNASLLRCSQLYQSQRHGGSTIFDRLAQHTSSANLPLYEDCRDTIERLLYHGSKLAAIMNSMKASNTPMANASKISTACGAYLTSVDRLTPNPIDQQETMLLRDYILLLRDTLSTGMPRPMTHIGGRSYSDHDLTIRLHGEFMRTNQRVLKWCSKIVLNYLQVSSARDSNLEPALGHLAYCCLFGDTVCQYVVQDGGINILVRLGKSQQLTDRHKRLTLRALAVLCSTTSACVQLLSLGGLELVVQALLDSQSWTCTVEAAGVLAQLTAPCHSFATIPPSLSEIVARLICLCEDCTDSDSFLLCTAALANLSVQHNQVAEVLYKNNAVKRILTSNVTRRTSISSYIKDQLVTILCRLSASGFEQIVIFQNGIPALLELVIHDDPQHPELASKIRSKAAIALGNIAATGYGVNIIHQHCGGFYLQKTIAMEGDGKSPVRFICTNLLRRLVTACDKETIV